MQSWSTMHNDLRLFSEAHLTQKYLQWSLVLLYARGKRGLVNVFNFKDFLKHLNCLLPDLNELAWNIGWFSSP